VSPIVATDQPVRQPSDLSVPAAAGPPAASDPNRPVAAGRDLTVDLMRAIAMVLVAVGHWLVVVPRFEDGRFDGVNALETVPLMGQLTWLFQVMPLFFAVGGFAGAASWRSARRKRTSYPDWLHARLVRLLRPTLVLFALWTAVTAAGRMLGADAELMELLGFLVVVPVWFLAVYVVVTALVPAFLVAHERHGVAVPAVLGVAALLVDAIRLGDGPEPITYLNFFFVFLLAQQLGFFWADGRVTRPLWWLAGGLAALWLATHVGPYPVSMVGVPGEELANNAPPTICLVALGVAQVGAAVAARPFLKTMLRRRPVQAATLTLNLHAMTILLWHFTALAVAALILLPLGVVPVFADGTAAWWLVRAASVVALAPILAGLVAVFGRFERVPSPSPPVAAPDPSSSAWATARLAGAVILLAAGFTVVAVRGLSEPSTPYGLPLIAIALIGGGTALVAVRRR
jgi:fucose 4-O-acetylase-like acetyltransferase